MIYPDISLIDWCEQHGIITTEIDCNECNSKLKFVKPIALTGYRGVEVEKCQNCGYDSKAFRVVPISKEKLAIWNKLI